MWFWLLSTSFVYHIIFLGQQLPGDVFCLAIFPANNCRDRCHFYFLPGSFGSMLYDTIIFCTFVQQTNQTRRQSARMLGKRRTSVTRPTKVYPAYRPSKSLINLVARMVITIVGMVLGSFFRPHHEQQKANTMVGSKATELGHPL